MNENKVLQQMKKNLLNEIEQLQHKINLVDQLLADQPVIESEPSPEGNGSSNVASKPSSAAPKRQRTASSNSIYSRIREVICGAPDQEWTTKELTEELKQRWKKDYGKKDNLLPVISAIMTCKENKKAKWFSRTKYNGKWYFQAVDKAPLKKTA